VYIKTEVEQMENEKMKQIMEQERMLMMRVWGFKSEGELTSALEDYMDSEEAEDMNEAWDLLVEESKIKEKCDLDEEQRRILLAAEEVIGEEDLYDMLHLLAKKDTEGAGEVFDFICRKLDDAAIDPDVEHDNAEHDYQVERADAMRKEK
jgi:hypothetical protein